MVELTTKASHSGGGCPQPWIEFPSDREAYTLVKNAIGNAQ
jgi:hypothetical protein